VGYRARVAIGEMGVVEDHARGDVLLTTSAVADVIVINSGYIKVVGEGSTDGQVLLDFGGPGDVLGALAYIDTPPPAVAVVALGATTVRRIAAPEFRQLLHRWPHVRDEIAVELLGRLHRLHAHRMSQLRPDIAGRLGEQLLDLAAVYGSPTGRGVAIDLPVTQQDLAAYLPASEKSVEAALRAFRDRGLIDTGYRALRILEPERLRNHPPNWRSNEV
jgi:CRP-like cAMP-binding protein